MLSVCVEQKDGAAVDADGEGEEEYGGCKERAGGEVVEMEGREESAREDWACDENGRWTDDEGGDFGMDAGVGEVEEAEGREEEDCVLLEEVVERSGQSREFLRVERPIVCVGCAHRLHQT